jgi:hypothetical protein
MKRPAVWAASAVCLILGAASAGAATHAVDHLLPRNFTVYVLDGGGVINWAAPGTHPVVLPTHNLYRGAGGGYVACYSHRAKGSAYPISSDIYVMGQLRLRGDYDGRIFQPRGYVDKDISAIAKFKQLCGQALAACRGNACWAGGDTGGWFGIQ